MRNNSIKYFFKLNSQTILLICIIVAVGFYTKFYAGPCHTWVNNSLGGVFYEIFWCLFVFLFYKKPAKIAIYIFIITSIIEFAQLWHPVFLEIIRKTFIGRTLVGNSFNYGDFIYYLTGCLISFFIMKRFLRFDKKQSMI